MKVLYDLETGNCGDPAMTQFMAEFNKLFIGAVATALTRSEQEIRAAGQGVLEFYWRCVDKYLFTRVKVELVDEYSPKTVLSKLILFDSESECQADKILWRVFE